MTRLTLTVLALALVSCPLVTAGPIEDKLDPGFAGATAVEKLAMLSVAKADKVLDNSELQLAIYEVVSTALENATTPKAKLEILGALNQGTEAALRGINDIRRNEDKRRASSCSLPSGLERVVALRYVVAEAGPVPTRDDLGCLARVRTCTSSSNDDFILAVVQGALSRDEAYGAADVSTKLAIIRALEAEGALGPFGRRDLEKRVLSDWLMAQIGSGASPTSIRLEFEKIKPVCFFVESWSEELLDAMLGVPPKRRRGGTITLRIGSGS